MAELSISPDVIRDALKDFVAAYEPTGAAATEVGTVIDAADGIAHVEGLPGVMANELVTFADGTQGLALNLDEHEVGVVVLGEFAGIEAGLHTVLVMTGISDQREIDRYPFRPSEVLAGVHELVASEPIEVEL